MGDTLMTFERHEKKFLLNERQYHDFMKAAGPYLISDQFASSQIHNIYFDTPDFALTRRSMEKPVYKEKLRVRSYFLPFPDTDVFVELKKKYKGIVYKRRISLPLSQAQNWLLNKTPCPVSSQIGKEIDAFLQRYPQIAPSFFLYYDRLSYQSIDGSNIRVTFDSNLRYRTDHLYLEEGGFGSPVLTDGTRIMEMKVQEAFPLPLCHLLDSLKIYPASFSKVGSACRLEMEKQMTRKYPSPQSVREPADAEQYKSDVIIHTA